MKNQQNKSDWSSKGRFRSSAADGNFGKLPPQDKSLEAYVLGAILLEPKRLAEVLEILNTPECFYVPANRDIFEAVLSLNKLGLPVDIMTVSDHLKKSGKLEEVGGYFYLTKITGDVTNTAHTSAHASILYEKYLLREVISNLSEITHKAYEYEDPFDLIQEAEAKIMKLGVGNFAGQYRKLSDTVIDSLTVVGSLMNKSTGLTGIPTGYKDIDFLTSGWQKSDLIILAARPSVGKTALALNFAYNAAKNGCGVGIFSLEMSAEQLTKRLLSMNSGIGLELISRGNLEPYQYEKLTSLSNDLINLPIFIEDTGGLNIFELRAKARRMVYKDEVKLIIVDYLQLMQGDSGRGGNREQEISKISRELKGLAKELDIPIIALSQLSRDMEKRSGKDKLPRLSDLRESGAIEQDADIVIFPTRDDYGSLDEEIDPAIKGQAWVRFAKHRNGRLDNIPMRTDMDTQRWYGREEQLVQKVICESPNHHKIIRQAQENDLPF